VRGHSRNDFCLDVFLSTETTRFHGTAKRLHLILKVLSTRTWKITKVSMVPGRILDHINLPPGPSSTGSSPHMSFWPSAINSYSMRKISRPADKLKALSGLANVVQRENGDTYMAGMWLSCLLQQLLWSADDLPYQTQRSNLYLAPSWSWASMECSVNLLGTIEHHPLAEVVRVYVEPVTELDGLEQFRMDF
jgi:hypothetical protein